jgi:hypothetical protein
MKEHDSEKHEREGHEFTRAAKILQVFFAGFSQAGIGFFEVESY